LSHAENIVERLGALFVETFQIETPAADADLLEAGILDSLQFVELLVRLEEEFELRIKIDDIDLDDLRTLARMAQMIAENSARAAVSAPPAFSSAPP
jgi:acyl carrier protein